MRVLKDVRQYLENYHLKAGIFHFYRGEFGPACEFFQKALDEEHLSGADRRAAVYFLVQTRISAAENHLAEGRFGRTIEEYRAALGVMPSYADVHARLAGAYLRIDDVARAIAHLEASVEINPRFVDGWTRLGYALLRAGRAAAARDAFRQALVRREEQARERLAEAETALDAGQLDAAGELFRHVFLEDEDRFRRHYHRGLLLLREEKWEDAASELEVAVECRPRYADVHNYLGVARAELGDLDAATASFRRSVEINPEYIVAWLNLAFTRHAAGDPETARQAVDQVLCREPDNAPARHLATELRAGGDPAVDQAAAGRPER